MREVSGLYHRRGWRIEVGDDAQADEVVVASIHEAMHERLQMTTLHGTTVALMQERAQVDGDAELLDTAHSLLGVSTRVHEEFATWMSAVPTGWGPSRLEASFPIYVRHLRRAARLVSDLPGDYLAMHAVQGIARSCMQSASLADVLQQIDPRELRINMLDHTARPDTRLMHLEQSLRRHGWVPLTEWQGDSRDLSPERFAEENDPEWAQLNQQAYEWCRSLLEDSGFPTLPYDGHLPLVRPLAHSLGVAGGRDDPPSSFIALMSVESETLVLGDRIPAVVLPRRTPVHEMTAGDLDRRHLFLAIRPHRSVLDQYDLTGAPIGATGHLAVLRCQRDDGVVELLNVSEMEPLAIKKAGAVVVSIAMSSLADETVSRHWAPLLHRSQAAVHCDLRPSTNLRDWLRPSERRIRYSIFGVESYVGTVTMFAFQIEEGRDVSRIYVCPISRLYSAGLQLWFTEGPELEGRTIRDDTLAETPVVRFAVAHTLLEERLFSFTSWDTK